MLYCHSVTRWHHTLYTRWCGCKLMVHTLSHLVCLGLLHPPTQMCFNPVFLSLLGCRCESASGHVTFSCYTCEAVWPQYNWVNETSQMDQIGTLPCIIGSWIRVRHCAMDWDGVMDQDTAVVLQICALYFCFTDGMLRKNSALLVGHFCEKRGMLRDDYYYRGDIFAWQMCHMWNYPSQTVEFTCFFLLLMSV